MHLLTYFQCAALTLCAGFLIKRQLRDRGVGILDATFFTPIFLFSSNVLGLFTYGVWELHLLKELSFYDLGVEWTQLITAFRDVLAFIVSFMVGVALCRFSRQTFGGRPSVTFVNEFRSIPRFENAALWAWAVVLVIFFFFYLSYGFSAILKRDFYLPEGGSVPLVILSFVGPISFIFFGYLLSQEKSNYAAVVVFLALIFLTILYLSFARRLASIGPVLALAMYFAARPLSVNRLILFSALAVALISALTPIVLAYRIAPDQGLLPLIDFLTTSIAPTMQSMEIGAAAIVLNFSFALPLTAFVAENANLNNHTFLVSLNPLPGGLVGWEELIRFQRYSETIPFNGIGELASYSLSIGCIYFGVVGFLFSFAETSLDRISGGARLIATTFVIGLCGNFCLTISQYNLRSATRMIWYLVILLAAAAIVSHVRKRRQQRARP